MNAIVADRQLQAGGDVECVPIFNGAWTDPFVALQVDSIVADFAAYVRGLALEPRDSTDVCHALRQSAGASGSKAASAAKSGAHQGAAPAHPAAGAEGDPKHSSPADPASGAGSDTNKEQRDSDDSWFQAHDKEALCHTNLFVPESIKLVHQTSKGVRLLSAGARVRFVLTW